AAPGYSSGQAMKALEETFGQTMPAEMGFDYAGMSYQEQVAQKGLSPMVVFGMSLVFVFLILAALYESWILPVSVLLGTPVAVAGALATLYLRNITNDVYAQIGLVMLIGSAACRPLPGSPCCSSLLLSTSPGGWAGATKRARRKEGTEMRNMVRALVAGSVCLLTGCLVGPKYQRPVVTAPALSRGQVAAEAASLADLPWWEIFRDETLRGLVQTALANNNDLRIRSEEHTSELQ